MRHSLRLLLTLVIVAIAIAAGIWLWRYYLYTPWTRDARIHAEVVTIAPDVSGWVNTLNVTDTDYVTQGDVLFEIDDTRYQTAVDRAQAMVVIYSSTGMDTASNLCTSGFPGSTVIVHMDTSYIWTSLL